MSKDKPPAPIVALTKDGLRPLDAMDAQDIMTQPIGTEFDLVKRSKRSWKQLRTYWKALGIVVANDARWPTAEHLHDDLKHSCGYVRKSVNLKTGEIKEVVDSIALNEMKQDDFNEYMKISLAFLAEYIGYDPLMFLNEQIEVMK